MIQKAIVFFLFSGICFSLPFALKHFTHGFKLAKIYVNSSFDVDFEESPSQEVQNILSQHFTYLNRGTQCYAFVSWDQKYVLKIFRKRKKSANSFFYSCKLARQLASRETGLVFLHLNPTKGTLPILQAKGPLGLSFQVPLDDCCFALQNKGELVGDIFKREDISKRLEEIIVLLEERISKNIGNKDPNLWRNFAFLEDRAIEIDFGNYIFRPDFSNRENARMELKRYMRPLRLWLQKHAPELVGSFDERVENTTL